MKGPAHIKGEEAQSLLQRQGKTLEDAFFAGENQRMIDKLRVMKKMKESVEALSRASGITNKNILEKLVELEIRPETLSSLSMVPLIEVAWADGEIDDRERDAVLTAIASMGMKKNSIGYQLMQQWLEHKPPKRLLEAWDHYIRGLCESLSSAQAKQLSRELLGHARSVAEASGGLLGLPLGNRVSTREAAMLARLNAAFQSE